MLASLLSQQFFLEGLATLSCTRLSNNRSVMPLDVLGRTRATLNRSTCSPSLRRAGKPLNPIRGRDRGLQLFPVNQECPVGAGHKPASITSLPFVHTARRYYRLNGLVRALDWRPWSGPFSLLVGGWGLYCSLGIRRKDVQAGSFRGSRSRNKVSVGEPAEGSLTLLYSATAVAAANRKKTNI